MESISRSDPGMQNLCGSEAVRPPVNQGQENTGSPADSVELGAVSGKAFGSGHPLPTGAGNGSEAKIPALPLTHRYVHPFMPPTPISEIPGLAGILDKEERAAPAYRFAPNYSIDAVMNSPDTARAFIKDYLTGEAPYFAIARHPESGLTFDGITLNKETGRAEEVRAWSAPSKESLDIGLCIKALEGNPVAASVISPVDPSLAPAMATEILEKKLNTYERFHRDNPGYGGFLPWFVSGADIKPTPDWDGQVPGLDNGEWVWSLLVAEEALRQKGNGDLADRYGRYNQLLRDHVVKMFYDPAVGKVRGDIKVVDPSSPDSSYEPAPGKCDYLDGVHESSMMLLYMTLLGNSLPEDASRRIWDNTTMKKVDTEWGTTWQAWAGSSHESWAHLFLPLRDLPPWQGLFRVREKIRSHNAAERKYPGFGSSTNEPGTTGYISASGIEGIGTFEPTRNDVFAIYGVFPMLLEFAGKDAGNYGLAWLLNMLQTQKMQGPLGGGESATNDGKVISHMKTIDGTFPNILAMTGGLARETAAVLRKNGVYEKFKSIAEGELKEAFG